MRGNGEKLAMNDGNYEGGTLVLTVCGFGFDDSNEKERKYQCHGFKFHLTWNNKILPLLELTKS